ncbi:MAG: cytochrome c biogenesis protein CcsA [Actinomycetes bacterium]|jgi:ABC-type uncharacterized transport system permease subunit|nr:cytochrome c biogenesis protein CcsA [Actinomycetes bacterium]
MHTLSIILFWAAFCVFLLASSAFAHNLVRPHLFSERTGRIATVLAWLLLTASIGLSHASAAQLGGSTPLTGSNQLVLVAWALVLAYFLLTYVLKFPRYGAALIPLTAALMFVAQIIPSRSAVPGLAPTATTVTSQMSSAYVTLHVILIIFGNALLLIGCVAAALYLYADHALRAHLNSALARALPSLGNIERLTVRVISIGLPIYVMGMALGVTRAIVVDARLWWADPRIILSGAVLVIFVTYLVVQLRQRLSAVTTSWMAVGGGVVIVVLMVLARTLPYGFHIFGVL